MKTLGIDIETYSEVDLTKCGVYAYTAHTSFEILLFAYAYDNNEIQLVDLANGEQIPEQVIKDITDDNIIKASYNAQFERICLSKYLNLHLSPVSWQCTAVQSAMLGLPLSLEGVGRVLGLQRQKIREGKSLIRYFSVPCKPTKTNGNRTRNLPHHAPDKWQMFKDYCIRDVEVERAIRLKLKEYPISEKEQTLYILDQQINDRGIRVDTELVSQAIFLATAMYSSAVTFLAKGMISLSLGFLGVCLWVE
jgi:DNA polymerase